MKKIILYIAIVLSMQSCISTRSILKDSKHKPVQFSKTQLNGKYKNHAFIWNDLRALNKTEQQIAKAASEEDIIEIKLLSDSELLVQLYCDNQILDQFTLKGKIKKNHFSLKRNFSLIPFFPVFYTHDEYKVLLANDVHGNLIFMEGMRRDGWLLVMGAGYGFNHSQIVKKVKS